jgi:hypothetical protein
VQVVIDGRVSRTDSTAFEQALGKNRTSVEVLVAEMFRVPYILDSVVLRTCALRRCIHVKETVVLIMI